MNIIKDILFQPLILSLVVGFFIFIFCYLRLPGVISFFKEKTLSSQKEVLEIIDKMMIKTPPERVIAWLWALSLGISFLFFLLCWPNLLLGVVFAGIGFLLSWIGVQRVMRATWEKRCSEVVMDMVEGLTVMVNGVRVGLSITQAMERVMKNMQGPLAQEFQLVLNKTQLGMSIEEALVEMDRRINRPDLTMMVTAINILKETGGNLAETLDVIVETLRSRQKVENKIKALTAQGSMQALIISCVPAFILIMMFFSNKHAAILMLTTPLGWVSLLLIIFLIILGSVMMKKIVTIQV